MNHDRVAAGAPAWVTLDFPPLQGVRCRHADKTVVCSITDDESSLVAFGVMLKGGEGRSPIGLYIALPVETARLVASKLIDQANLIDGGKGNS